jgi:ribose transport system permease protein
MKANNKNDIRKNEGIDKSIYRMGFKRFYRAYFTQFSLVGLLIICAVAMTFLSPYFLTAYNFRNLSIYITITATLAAGQTMILLSGGIDLSQAAAMALGVMFAGLIFQLTGNAWLAILLTILVCALIGVINALIITKVGIPSFIATIGLSLIWSALAFIITDAKNVLISNKVFKFIGFGNVLGVPVLFWIMFLVYVFVFLFLKYTATGRSMYAAGGNGGAAFLSGIKVDKIRSIAYILSGALVGISCVLWVGQMNAAMPQAGSGLAFDPIIGSVIGGIGFSGGKGTVIGTFLGICILTLFANAMVLLNIQSFYQNMLKGAILILAVALDSIRGSGGAGMPGL